MKFNLTPRTFYVLTGVVGAVGAGLLWMSNSSITDQSAHIDSLRKELRDEKEVQKELDDSKKRVEDLKFKLKHLEEGVQQFAYIPTMMKELETYGKSNKIQIIQIKPIIVASTPGKDKDDRKKNAYEEMNVNIKCRGSYEDSLRFLQAIKVFPKIVAVRTVSLSPHTDNNTKKVGKPVLDLELELRAYAFKDDQKETKTASTANGGSNES